MKCVGGVEIFHGVCSVNLAVEAGPAPAGFGLCLPCCRSCDTLRALVDALLPKPPAFQPCSCSLWVPAASRLGGWRRHRRTISIGLGRLRLFDVPPTGGAAAVAAAVRTASASLPTLASTTCRPLLLQVISVMEKGSGQREVPLDHLAQHVVRTRGRRSPP